MHKNQYIFLSLLTLYSSFATQHLLFYTFDTGTEEGFGHLRRTPWCKTTFSNHIFMYYNMVILGVWSFLVLQYHVCSTSSSWAARLSIRRSNRSICIHSYTEYKYTRLILLSQLMDTLPYMVFGHRPLPSGWTGNSIDIQLIYYKI